MTSVGSYFYANWTTQSTGIATVDYYRTHTKVGTGSTLSRTNGYLKSGTGEKGSTCPTIRNFPTGNDNVRKPHHLKVFSDTYQSASACPTTARRLIEYQEVDINNAAVGTIQSKEQFASISTNTCNNGTPKTSTDCSTDPDGVFIDAQSINCNTVGGSCGVTAKKQQWLWCPGNGTTPVVIATPGDIILHNDSISVGGNTAGFAAGTYIYP